MSITSSGKRGSFLRRGRSMMTFTHASQPSSRQAATPRMWTRTSSWMRFHTRQNVPRRSPSNRLQSAPRCRRARRSTTMAYSSFPSNQTAANGLPSFARNLPTSHTLFQRFIAISICPLTRDRALMVSALSRDGVTVVKTRPPRPKTASCPLACGLSSDSGYGYAVGPHGLAPLLDDTRGESHAPHPGWAPARGRR